MPLHMTIYRSEYTPYPFELPEVDLTFDLAAEKTLVTAKIKVKAKPQTAEGTALVLDGSDIELLSLRINGNDWPDYSLNEDGKKLIISNVPREFDLEIESACKPQENTALMGLYVSGASLFTQCEAEGFRRICWFADRPDVMSRYKVTMRACPKQYPQLLSNGNLLQTRMLEDGRQECVWEDPFPKPCYLFALVAGQFDCREHTLQTRSGKPVLLQIYSDPGTYDKTEWAMQSLIQSLRWDETRFGLELDLDRFMIVAAADFNMGAMENKGLNIFNAAYVLADPNTATDANFRAIQAVIGHEYFHNWTGNRVTCRSWFELSLKEGLTVFRDQEFTADMMAEGLEPQKAESARAVKRIDDVVVLRAAQFPEDAGPMAHPIRPESYEEISNFYTATVYEKGAEVIRMMHTLLGESTFQEGMKEYFRRHDGQAVTCDDFVSAMEHAWRQKQPDRDLSVFSRWYSQAGTPTVMVELLPGSSDDEIKIKLSQACPPVGIEQKSGIQKLPLHIPFAIGAISRDGQPLTLQCGSQKGQTLLLELMQEEQTWTIKGWRKDAVASLLRNFSAPVNVVASETDEDLHLLARHDPNAFARWESVQKLLARMLLSMLGKSHAEQQQMVQPSHSPAMQALVSTFGVILADTDLDDAYKTRLMSLPTDKYLLQQMPEKDPLAVAQARMLLVSSLGKHLASQLLEVVRQTPCSHDFDVSPLAAGRRAMANLALDWLNQAAEPEAKTLAIGRYNDAGNMTERFGALQALLRNPEQDQVIGQVNDDFYQRFKDDALVVDKWFSLQATAPTTDVNRIKELLKHPAFTLRNPNRLRALVFQFCMNNPLGFHANDGSGYKLWAELVCTVDSANPEVAARLARVMDLWRSHKPGSRDMMRKALESVAAHKNLSTNTREIVQKALSL